MEGGQGHLGFGDNVKRDKNVINNFGSPLKSCISCDNLISKEKYQEDLRCNNCQNYDDYCLEQDERKIRESHTKQAIFWSILTTIAVIIFYLLLFKEMLNIIPSFFYRSSIFGSLLAQVLSIVMIFFLISIVFMRIFYEKSKRKINNAKH